MITREKKDSVIKDIKARLKGAKLVILADFTGLKNSQLDELRRDFRESNIEYKVAKKTLLKLSGIETQYPGSIGLAISRDDEITPSKIIYNSKMKMIAGILDGNPIDLTLLETFAKLATKDELLPKFAYILKGNINKLILILKQHGEKGEK